MDFMQNWFHMDYDSNCIRQNKVEKKCRIISFRSLNRERALKTQKLLPIKEKIDKFDYLKLEIPFIKRHHKKGEKAATEYFHHI